MRSFLRSRFIAIATRWYLKQARPAYQHEAASFARVNAGIQETVAAGRTIEAFRLGPARVDRTDSDIKDWMGWERRTLWLRTVFFGSSEASYVMPLVLCLIVGGLLHIDGHLSAGAVAAAALYAQQLVVPIDTLLAWQDEVQLASASLSRVVGVSEVPPSPTTDQVPADDRLVATTSSTRTAKVMTFSTGSTWSRRREPGLRSSVRAVQERARSRSCSPVSTRHVKDEWRWEESSLRACRPRGSVARSLS